MSRKCDLTGRGPGSGNRVSHANNKTRRRFLANLKPCSLHSEILGRPVKMRLCTRVLRTITKHGGIDSYLMKTPESRLTPEGIRLKRQVAKIAARGRSKNKKAAAA
ncbi:MAG: 50S ribosomal protein L28 [Candidatus Binatia bacterium]